MYRSLTSLMLVAFLLFPSVGTALVQPSISPVITLKGRLIYDTVSLVPHYTLQGFVLLHDDPGHLEALTGQEVVVIGSESSEPSIFMRRSLIVREIKAAEPDITLPVENPVTLPISPAPVPAIPPVEGEEAIKPVQSVPFFGTPFVILFGQVHTRNGQFYIIQDQATGLGESLISSDLIDLGAMEGDRVGLVAAKQEDSENGLYLVQSAISLTGDLGRRIEEGTGLIYAAPAREISVRMEARIVEMDQAPVLGNSRTLMGVRAIAESMGANVTWNDQTLTASIALEDREVSVMVGSNHLTVRVAGQPETIVISDTTAVIVSGRMMIPVRVLAEVLGLQVNWDAATWTVDLTRG